MSAGADSAPRRAGIIAYGLLEQSARGRVIALLHGRHRLIAEPGRGRLALRAVIHGRGAEGVAAAEAPAPVPGCRYTQSPEVPREEWERIGGSASSRSPCLPVAGREFGEDRSNVGAENADPIPVSTRIRNLSQTRQVATRRTTGVMSRAGWGATSPGDRRAVPPSGAGIAPCGHRGSRRSSPGRRSTKRRDGGRRAPSSDPRSPRAGSACAGRCRRGSP